MQLSKVKLGLVLAGGGGKGAYQIGVLKALANLGMGINHFTAIAGSSIGALNMALFAQGDLDLAERVWLSVTPDQIFSLNPRILANSYLRCLPLGQPFRDLVARWAFTIASRGIFSRKGLCAIIDQNLDLSLVANHGPGQLIAVCLQFPLPKVKYFTLNALKPEKVKAVLLASSALPMIYNPVKIDRKYYVDGGVVDNIPLAPVADCGCNAIIVIHLHQGAIIDKAHYSQAKIYEIFPSRPLGSLLNGTLDFSPQGIRDRIELGYQDGLKISQFVGAVAKSQIESLQCLQMVKENLHNEPRHLPN